MSAQDALGARADAREEHRLAVIVVNYRRSDLVLDCLASVMPEIDAARDVVLVVDNASGDGSVARLHEHVTARGWTAVQIIAHERNDGFAAGNNVGLARARASAYLLLNSDTLVRPGAVDLLWQALQAHPRAGLVSPRLEWPDGEPQISCFRDHTALSEIIRGSATGPLRGLLDRWDVPLPVSDAPGEVPWTSFAAVLLRGEAWRQLGPLDEGYFMFYEDAAYCRTLRAAGWTVHHEPRARVVHLRGGSSPVKALTAARKRRPRYFYASRTRYFRQGGGRAGLLLANLCWTAGRTIAWLRETLGRKQPHTCEGELVDTWRG